MRKMKYGDTAINLSILTLSIFGIVMIGSASAGNASYLGTEYAIKNMIKQFIFVVIGYLIMTFIRRIFSIRYVNRNTLKLAYIIILIAMFSTLLFASVNGSKAWIRLFNNNITIQPSEFAKIVIILLLSYMLVETPKAYSTVVSFRNIEEQKRFKHQQLFECIIKPLGLAFILIFITLFLQKDLGTAVIMLFITIICFFSTNHKYYRNVHFYSFLIVLGVIFITLLLIFLYPSLLQKVLGSHQGARIASWLDPFTNVQGESYQIVNGLLSFAKGGVWGVGLTNSTLKYGYIPEAHNDYITAIICEELGLVGLALIIVPYCIIIFKIMNYAFEVKDAKEKIMLIGISSFFFIHLFFNVGGVSGLIPMTGVPLLCVSSGGSGVWASYIAIGLAQAIISKNRRNGIIK